jgi:hypothetical protein
MSQTNTLRQLTDSERPFTAVLPDSDYVGDRVELQSIWTQDRKFCDAMLRAIHAGHETPPMLGVDTRPGTRSPITMVR